jgi:sulfotransferase family protein
LILRADGNDVTETTQVFIVGMNGSGTTLLLDCLAGHSMIYGFKGETKALPFFIECQPKYGDLFDDRRFRRLWHDLRIAIGGRGWRSDVSGAAVDGWGGKPRSVAAVFDAIMSSLATAEGKRVWCEKTPMYVHHLRTLANAFPNAKFVHIIRDGRDCAASFHRRWRFNSVRTIFRWKRAVGAGREQGASIGDRYREIRYERLTAAPEACLQEICRFLDVPFEQSILKPARLRPEMTGSSERSIARNERRADHYFSPDALRQLERVAGRQLAECGYSTHYVEGNEDPPKLRLRWWEIMDDFRRLRDTLRTAADMQRSRRVSYVSRRVIAALRQKLTLR